MATVSKYSLADTLTEVLLGMSDQGNSFIPADEGARLLEVANAIKDSGIGVQYINEISKRFGQDKSYTSTILTDGILIGIKVMEKIYGKSSN